MVAGDFTMWECSADSSQTEGTHMPSCRAHHLELEWHCHMTLLETIGIFHPRQNDGQFDNQQPNVKTLIVVDTEDSNTLWSVTQTNGLQYRLKAENHTKELTGRYPLRCLY